MSEFWEKVKRILAGFDAPSSSQPRQSSASGLHTSGMTHSFTFDTWTVALDLSDQILSIGIPPEMDYGDGTAGHTAIYPTLADLSADTFEKRAIVSASMLAWKAKVFDDGLYAAVDLAAQHGTGKFRGKARLLREMLAELEDISVRGEPSAAGILFGAALLGGQDLPVSKKHKETVRKTVEAFLGNELRSKPIGFYTWSSDLERIFQQDRMLQEAIKDSEDLIDVVRVLHGNAEARSTYEAYLQLVAGLTNPMVKDNPDLRPLLSQADQGPLEAADGDYYFFPPSRAHETELIKKIYGDEAIPEGFSLIDEMIKRIRDGRLSLKPSPNSGWYDYQTWALAPLAVPEKTVEARKLHLDNKYIKQLEALFKGALALARETHIKQLEIPCVGAGIYDGPHKPTIPIYPKLSFEPVLTYYLRRAVSYRFIGQVLKRCFGTEGMREMFRRTPDGASSVCLEDELNQIHGMFLDAAISCGRELGLSEHEITEETSEINRALTEQWGEMQTEGFGRVNLSSDRLSQDPDLARDGRMMVPVFYDLGRSLTKVWAFLGWSRQEVTVSFARPPHVRVTDRAGREATDDVFLEYLSRSYTLAYPVTAEIYVDKVLNRDEFRAHCDRYKTFEAITANLV